MNGKTVKITCTNANTAYNVVTGTTSAPTGARNSDYVGEEVTFQNQTSGTVASVGGSDVVSTGGIQLSYLASATDRGGNPSAIQLQEYWVSSNTNGGVVLVRLRKRV